MQASSSEFLGDIDNKRTKNNADFCCVGCGCRSERGSVPKWQNFRGARSRLVAAVNYQVPFFKVFTHANYSLALCAQRVIHERAPDGKGYFFSWRDPALQGVEEDWLGARNYCRQRCMDSISVETSPENEWIKQRIVDGKVSEISGISILNQKMF